jgi:adenylate cyclase
MLNMRGSRGVVMGQEIERKFFVRDDTWRSASNAPRRVRQGYIGRGANSVVRVRTIGDRAFLTIKSADAGRVRSEYEYEIPLADADELLAQHCNGELIEKVRHRIDWDGLEWTIDEFEGRLAGLVLAEIELYATDQDIELPPWAGREVTEDAAYRNERLAVAAPPALR